MSKIYVAIKIVVLSFISTSCYSQNLSTSKFLEICTYSNKAQFYSISDIKSFLGTLDRIEFDTTLLIRNGLPTDQQIITILMSDSMVAGMMNNIFPLSDEEDLISAFIFFPKQKRLIIVRGELEYRTQRLTIPYLELFVFKSDLNFESHWLLAPGESFEQLQLDKLYLSELRGTYYQETNCEYYRSRNHYSIDLMGIALEEIDLFTLGMLVFDSRNQHKISSWVKANNHLYSEIVGNIIKDCKE